MRVRLAASGSVGWYKAWAQGEWTSPDPVPLFDLFMRNGSPLGDAARAKGPWRLVNRLAHALRANHKSRARRNIEHHYDLAQQAFFSLHTLPPRSAPLRYWTSRRTRCKPAGRVAAQYRPW